MSDQIQRQQAQSLAKIATSMHDMVRTMNALQSTLVDVGKIIKMLAPAQIEGHMVEQSWLDETLTDKDKNGD
jgi:methyl-accepting chemotaxis protein